MPRLPLPHLPRDPVNRVKHLTQVRQEVLDELDAALADTYFEARLKSCLPQAQEAGPHSMTTVLRMVRRVNVERGQSVRWRDGLDPSSTAHS